MVNPENWSCPLPASRSQRVLLGHGGGGRLSAELIEQIFVPAFGNPHLEVLGDAAVLSVGGTRLAFSTDSYVVHPLFFPGGCIGDLAVHGTLNDLAMMGAKPLFLSAGFILEEGLELDALRRVVAAMGRAARECGVEIVTGDTKVVERGHGDGLYINTAGIGVLLEGISPAPQKARSGDLIVLSGEMAQHGMAIMSVRQGLEFESEIRTDSASLYPLVELLTEVCPDVHVMRDPTRGGVAASLHEIANASRVGIEIEEAHLPIAAPVASACELLGLDPLYVANEGKLLAIVPAQAGPAVVEALKSHPLGQQACLIGRVVDEHAGMVLLRTRMGTRRVIDLALGEPLPRIC